MVFNYIFHYFVISIGAFFGAVFPLDVSPHFCFFCFELSVFRETAFRVVCRRKRVFGIPRDLFSVRFSKLRRNRVAVVAPAESWGPKGVHRRLSFKADSRTAGKSHLGGRVPCTVDLREAPALARN